MTSAYLSLVLADGRLPTGAHTQSAGVEPALLGGLRLDQVPDYVAVRLRTVAEVEAAAAVVARHQWCATPAGGRAAALLAVDAAWRARTVSDALRSASELLARSYLATAGAVWDLAPLSGPESAAIRWCRPVVVGAVSAAAGLSAAETARLIGYDDVQTVVSAALKIVPFDPVRSVRWTVAAAGAVEALVERVAGLTDPADLPAPSAPMIDEWAQQHQTRQRRLFRA